MATFPKSGAPRTDGGGWSLAAALGLLAVAFLWDRLAPPPNVAPPGKDAAFPEKKDGNRDASPAAVATEGKDRGRLAAGPSEIPPRGWKDVLLRVYGNISEHRILAVAAGMTYTACSRSFRRWRHSSRSTVSSRIRAPSPSTSTRCPDFYQAVQSISPEISSRASPRRDIRRSV